MILKKNGNSVVYSSDNLNIRLFYGNRGHCIWCCRWNLPQTDPCCHGNQNLGILCQICYNSAYTRDI